MTEFSGGAALPAADRPESPDRARSRPARDADSKAAGLRGEPGGPASLADCGLTRRRAVGGLLGAGSAIRYARAAGGSLAAPLLLDVTDTMGALRLLQPAFVAYQRARPDLVSRISFSETPARMLAARLAEQKAGREAGFDLALVGPSLMDEGVGQGLWQTLLPDQAAALPDLRSVLLPAAWSMQGLTRGQGVVLAYSPCGPVLQFLPGRTGPAPSTAAELLAWTRTHPGRFGYAHPAHSEAGRALLMGLPAILGDADPGDPRGGWEKTWTFLDLLGGNVGSYAPGTGALLTQLREGERDMIAGTVGLDMQARAVGDLPAETGLATLRGFHWISAARYAAVPKGLRQERLAVVLDLLGFLLSREAQASTYDFGAFYPGPAVAGVSLDMAPQRSLERLRPFERPLYPGLIAGTPAETPLVGERLAYALRRWEEQIGRGRGE